MRVYSFKADEDLIRRLDRIAAQRNMARSELIRRIITSYLATQTTSTSTETKRIKVY